MTIEEKNIKIDSIRKEIKFIEKKLEEASNSKDYDKASELNKKLLEKKKDLSDINSAFKSQRDGMTDEAKRMESITDFKEEAVDLLKEKRELDKIIKSKDSSEEDITDAKSQLSKNKKAINNLKARIYSEALEKSNLEYAEGERYPKQAEQRYINEIKNLKEQGEALKLQNEEAIKRIKEANSAVREKYSDMLNEGKISQDIYDKKNAEIDTRESNEISNIEKSLKDISNQISDKEKKLDEVKKKAKIYDEYANMYKAEFGEELDDFSRNRTKSIKKARKENEIHSNESTVNKDISEFNTSKETNRKEFGERYTNSSIQSETIETKKQFDESYKKLDQGYLKKADRENLYNVLENKENFGKFGITTGMIFNKSRAILKAEARDLSADMLKFMQNTKSLFKEINFLEEKKENLPISSLKNWNKIKELEENEKKFYVQDCIKMIEDYRASGAELSNEQEKMYLNALALENKIEVLKKSVTNYSEIKKERKSSMLEKISSLFADRKKTLPEADKVRTDTSIDDPGDDTRGYDLFVELRDKVDNGEMSQKEADIIGREFDEKQGRDTSRENKSDEVYNEGR